MFLVCYSIDVFINFIAWEKIWRTEGNAENLVFEAKNVFFRLNAKHSYIWKLNYTIEKKNMIEIVSLVALMKFP